MTTETNYGPQMDLLFVHGNELKSSMLEQYYQTFGYPCTLILNRRVQSNNKENDLVTVFGSSVSQNSEVNPLRIRRESAYFLMGRNEESLVANRSSVTVPIYSNFYIDRGTKVEMTLHNDVIVYVVSDEPKIHNNNVYECQLSPFTSYNEGGYENV